MSQPFVLADDLTGALEAGAAFRAAGWKVLLPLMEGGGLGAGSGVLHVLSTETRNATAPVASAAVRQVLLDCRRSGARLLLKKIDSTLRGPIGVELSAVIEVMRPPLVVICPANPSAGRTVIDGVVHVDGLTLEKTDFRHDPAWPATTGNVSMRLGAEGVMVHGCLRNTTLSGGEAAVRDRITKYMTGCAGTCIIVSDASTMGDVETVASVALDMVPDVVFLGSGALGTVLAGRFRPDEKAPVDPVAVAESMLVLCGSRHPASHRQVEFLSQNSGALVILAGLGESLADVVDQAVAGIDAGRLVAVKCDPGDVDLPLDTVSKRLGEFASRLFAVRSPGVLYLTGGETARYVCRSLGARSLEVIRELEPGVVSSRFVRGEAGMVAVISKPGGYGDPGAMARHFRENKMQ